MFRALPIIQRGFCWAQIAEDKARCAGQGGSLVKQRDAGIADFGANPPGSDCFVRWTALFAPSLGRTPAGAACGDPDSLQRIRAARSCGTTTHRSLRLASEQNGREQNRIGLLKVPF